MSFQPWRRRLPATKLLLRPWLTYKRSSFGRRLGIKNFHRFIVNIILMMKVCKGFRAGLKGLTGFQLIEKECVSDLEEDKKTANVVFDRHEFSVSKEHFPFRAIQITRKPPAWRTDSEIRHLRNRLQLLESFRQYSPTLQLLLAKVIRFERFGRRRVIIKKGHWATSFYFIYCGSVAITDDDDGSTAFADTVPTTLQRGAAFGEIALLQRTKRIATVVCMEETELLVVDRKDFFGYKLDKELQKECKYRYDFLRSVELFETMGDAAIEKLANFCRIERFHYGQVITNDLKDSSMLIFITKGICEVLRLIDLSTCASYQKWISKQLCLPRPKLQRQEKRRIASEIACVDRFKSTMWNSYSGQRLNDLKDFYIHQQKQQKYYIGKKQSSLFEKSHKSVVIKVDTCDKGALCEPEVESSPSPPNDEKEVVQRIISGSFGKKPSYTTSFGEIPSSVAAAVYVRIDEVRKGEYLINIEDDRVMLLISQGADILRLRREKLESCADDITLSKLYKIKISYPRWPFCIQCGYSLLAWWWWWPPKKSHQHAGALYDLIQSDDELCQVFLRQNAWEFFKKDLLDLVIQSKLMRTVYPPHPCPTEEIYRSWCMNKAGIFDVSTMRYKTEPPEDTYKYVPSPMAHGSDALPQIKPRLIHGINMIRPSLNGAF